MFNFLIYADDTTLSSTLNMFNGNVQNQNFESLIHTEILKINGWLEINKLSPNEAKSKYMTFQKADAKVKANIQIPTLKLYNVNIEQFKQFTVSGLIIDTNISWGKNTFKKYQMHILKTYITLNKLKHMLPLHI